MYEYPRSVESAPLGSTSGVQGLDSPRSIDNVVTIYGNVVTTRELEVIVPRPTIPARAETVLDRAREAILEHGYRNVSIADIARRAGVGKGAIYLDFPSKEALLEALLTRSMRGLSKAVRDKVAASEEVVSLSVAFRFGLQSLLDDRLMLALYLGDADTLGEYVRGRDPSRYQARQDWLTRYLDDLRKVGLIRGDLDPTAAARLLSVFAVGLANAGSVLGALSSEQLGETVDLMTSLIENGWERPEPSHPEAARRAHTALLDRLDQQIGTS